MDARLGVDVGGTFTDVVLIVDADGDGGEVTTAKVPTTADQSEGVMRGIEAACERAGIDPAAVGTFRHGTTVATNALLEGEGAEAALVTTAGFRDVLAIGRQDRPALYDIDAERPDPLVPRERRYEVDERATTAGIKTPIDEPAVHDLAERIDAEAVAVSLLHAYAHPENERRVAAILDARLDATVVASHETLAAFREYERTATTVADAAVTPVIDAYLGRLAERADERRLPEPRVMQSNGGIADAATVREHGVRTALSGPAAGVVGAALFEPPGADGVVTFDMGGTSCDVGLVRGGRVERTTEGGVGDRPIGLQTVDIETVGAGGGSIAWVDDGGALRVGPRSAGAEPGPACYGKGGTEPTVTDAAVVLGYLGEDAKLGGGLDLDAGAAEAALRELAGEADLDGPIVAAHGVYEVANATMARAIRAVTLERGHDPRGFALVAFGGAGPMHAAALAGRLGIGRVLVPRANGVLSALGLLAAEERHDAVRTVREGLADADPDAIEARYEELSEQVLAETAAPEEARLTREADLRYAGQSHELTVELGDSPFDPADAADRFHATHERVRGYRLDEPVEAVTLRTVAIISGEEPTLAHEGTTTERRTRRPVHAAAGGDGSGGTDADGPRETPVYDRERAAAGTAVDGPAVFEGRESTIVLPPGWTATVDGRGTIMMEAEP